MNIYSLICKRRHNRYKQLAVLLDPQKAHEDMLFEFASNARRCKADYVFVGGSLVTQGLMEKTFRELRRQSQAPLIIFPGDPSQIDPFADGILLLSLISGRNPELLIGNHVRAAMALKETELEILPTGYMLIESGKLNSVLYMSNTLPIPSDKPDIAVATALAGQQLGLSLIYMDAGSGARYPVPEEMISQVRKNTSSPLIVGGGIRTAEDAHRAWKAGADIVVVGNALEAQPALMEEMAAARDECNRIRV